MAILAVIFGLLLLLFGGGCTLIFVAGGIMDPKSMFADIPLVLTMWLPLGLLPLVLGWLLFRYGVRKDRERRAAQAAAPRPAKVGEQ